MAAKSPEAGTSSAETSPGAGVSRVGTAARYARLRAADASHKLHALLLPSEEELRAAALGARPAVGPPPRLPHQLSPALTSVLLGWRSLYESCRSRSALQRLVGESYAPEAVFEDALVSARGQEAVYRQFAMLGAAVRAVQVGAYSLSVVPLSRPVVEVPVAALLPSPAAKAKAAAERAPQQPSPRRGAQRLPQRQRPPGLGPGPGGAVPTQAPASAAAGGGPPGPSPSPGPSGGTCPLHLTRVAVENVQSFTLAAPSWLTWLLGIKGPGLQVDLYVTSILLVVSDEPLAMDGGVPFGPSGAFDGGSAAGASDVTARRLAGAAAALGAAAAAAPSAVGGPGGYPGGRPDPDGASSMPAWRIVHQVDLWHNVPLVWWRARRALCLALDTVLSPLLGL